MPEPVPYRIERLTLRHGSDYLRFFDHEKGPAFAAAGFVEIARHDNVTVVRKSLR